MATPPDTSVSWAPGRQLAGRYVLERPLSDHEVLPVWRAFDHRLTRSVEVRGVNVSLTADQRTARRVRRQLVALSGIEHEGLARIYDTVVDGPWLAVISELLDDAVTVGEALPEIGQDWRTALAVGERLTAALGALHEAGLVHRRVSRHAVVLTRRGAVLLATEHVHHMLSETTQTTDEVLSRDRLSYLAPEIAAGQGASRISDVYAAGVVLWELVAGRPVVEVLEVPVWTTLLPALAATHAEVPRKVDELIARATAAEPSDRYPQAATLNDELQSLLPARPERFVARLLQRVGGERS